MARHFLQKTLDVAPAILGESLFAAGEIPVGLRNQLTAVVGAQTALNFRANSFQMALTMSRRYAW